MPEVRIKYPEGTYEGEVNDANEPEGQGCLEFPGNDEFERQSYEGAFKGKKAHGHGLMRWREGDKYEGDWVDGLRHGQGTYFSKVNEKISFKNLFCDVCGSILSPGVFLRLLAT